jgi:hypothetical protein
MCSQHSEKREWAQSLNPAAIGASIVDNGGAHLHPMGIRRNAAAGQHFIATLRSNISTLAMMQCRHEGDVCNVFH